MKSILVVIWSLLVAFVCGFSAWAEEGAVFRYRQIDIPSAFIATSGDHAFGGDIRIGDLSGTGVCDFVVYRSSQGGDVRKNDGGIKPCYIAAFDIDGNPLWEQGEGGEQPVRPGPVSVYDFDGDGSSEIACLWHRPDTNHPTDWLSLSDVVFQIRDGKTGRVLRERAIPEIASIRTSSPSHNTWPHQRTLVANFRGLDRPRDLLLKAGDTYVALTDQLEVLWTYQYRLKDDGNFPPKFPAVGDMNGDGRDEVYGGYFLLSPDGKPHWTQEKAQIMDSVTIHEWDSPNVRAISSGTPQIMGFDLNPILSLGDEIVPHGQELRVADFSAASPGTELAIRNHGHEAHLVVVGNSGKILQDFDLNEVPNNTGMESVYLQGPDRVALLFNGGLLWNLENRTSVELPDLPAANGKGVHRMGFYHAIPAEITGDGKEDLVVYDPTSTSVFIYSMDSGGLVSGEGARFTAGPRQYNPRLMD